MGLKRKASVFEDNHVHTEPNSSLIAPQLPVSPLFPFASPRLIIPGRVPISHINSRTRKRHRDGRPDEETIHENTLKKLYDAQRFHLDERVPVLEAAAPVEETVHQMDHDVEMMDEPEAELPQTIQPDQKTIDSFFGGKDTSHTTTTGSSWTQNFSLPTPATTPQKPEKQLWQTRSTSFNATENQLGYPHDFPNMTTPPWTEC